MITEDIIGDQVMAKQCFLTIVKGKDPFGQVQSIEVKDQEILEDIGSPLKERSLEELKKLYLNDSNSMRFFSFENNLPKQEEEQLV